MQCWWKTNFWQILKSFDGIHVKLSCRWPCIVAHEITLVHKLIWCSTFYMMVHNFCFPFQQVAQTLGLPPKPSPFPDFQNTTFGELSDEVAQKIKVTFLGPFSTFQLLNVTYLFDSEVLFCFVYFLCSDFIFHLRITSWIREEWVHKSYVSPFQVQVTMNDAYMDIPCVLHGKIPQLQKDCNTKSRYIIPQFSVGH